MQKIVDNYRAPLSCAVLFRRRYLTRGVSIMVGMMPALWLWAGNGLMARAGSCYYFDESGVMQSSKWIDGDYVDAEGKWICGA